MDSTSQLFLLNMEAILIIACMAPQSSKPSLTASFRATRRVPDAMDGSRSGCGHIEVAKDFDFAHRRQYFALMSAMSILQNTKKTSLCRHHGRPGLRRPVVWQKSSGTWLRGTSSSRLRAGGSLFRAEFDTLRKLPSPLGLFDAPR